MVRYLIITFFGVLFFHQTVLGQTGYIIAGVVKDAHSEELLPFASVQFIGSTIGTLTDSAGRFRFHLSERKYDSLLVTCVGYQPYKIYLDPNRNLSTLNILMERGTFNEGAQVRVKINKGLFVWKKIVAHKPQNDRYRFYNFSYELYNKLEVDLKNINFQKIGKFKPLKPVTDIINSHIDSSEGTSYLPSYLTESISNYYYQKNPLKRREEINALNTNGIKNESMNKWLGGMDQVVNVYNNFIAVFDREFVSPISDNGDYYYNYRVVDTQVINKQRFLHLVFTPRRKGGDTFEGDCWVHSGTYAIQKMNLRLGKEANINFVEHLSLIQEYSMINDSTWFLAKDKFVVEVTPIGKDMPGFIGRKTTTYKNVVVNDSTVVNALKKNKILEEVVVAGNSQDKPTGFWADARHEPLNKNEQGIVTMIDTLTKAPAFQKMTKTMTFLGSGYKDIGNYKIGPWMNWVSANNWEGMRVRFDFGTNKRFNKKIKLHTYLAYGFDDKKIKGMAEFFYLPKKDPRTYLFASFTKDLDWGQNYYGEVSQDNIFALAVRKKDVNKKAIQVEEKKLEYFKETFPWMSNRITVSHKSYTPLRNLIPIDSFPSSANGDAMKNFEVTLRLRFAYLERFVENQFYRTSLGSIYPILEINISKGIAGVLRSNYSYTKLSANLSDNMKLPPLGSFSWMLFAGKTTGTLPYTQLDIAPGNDLFYYNKYAFNMMNRWEFIHDKYAGGIIEHNIGNGIFQWIPKLKFRQFWNAKMLVGGLSQSNKDFNFKTGNVFQTLNGKPYLELGTGVDNIFKIFRLDFVWRVLPTQTTKVYDKNFGVFGSFRLSF